MEKDVKVKRREELQEQFKEYPETLEPGEVSLLLGVSRRYVDTLIHGGVIPAFPLDPNKQRKQYRVTKADLIGYIINNSYGGNE